MSATIAIPEMLNGPARSANGGIAAGYLAGELVERLGLDPWATIQVRLNRPPPLKTAMAVIESPGGSEATEDDEAVTGGVDLVLGDHLVASATTSTFSIEVPEVAPEEAEAATGPMGDHPAPTCVVCGTEHPRGLGVWPGPVERFANAGEGDAPLAVRAALWHPPAWSADEGVVRAPLLWGVLDCPGAFASADAHAAAAGTGDPIFAALGTMSACLLLPVPVDEPSVVLGWSLGSDGRKLHGGTAILGVDGELRGVSLQTCLAMPAEWAAS